jgi:hypothetical protein
MPSIQGRQAPIGDGYSKEMFRQETTINDSSVRNHKWFHFGGYVLENIWVNYRTIFDDCILSELDGG